MAPGVDPAVVLVGGDPSDQEEWGLIAAHRGGDPGAFDRFYVRWRPQVQRFVLKHVSNTADAEDITQKIFVTLHGVLGQFRGESKFSTWLYSVSLNHVRNFFRYQSVRPTRALEGQFLEGETRALQWEDSAPSPEAAAVVHHDMGRLFAAVENLSQEQRQIFSLFYFQHRSLKEISEIFQKPLNTVKVYLHRARRFILSTCGDVQRDKL